MELKKYELKKAFSSPIVLGLMGLFIAFNSFFIYTHAHMKCELSMLTELVLKFGHEINESSLANWDDIHKEQLARLNEKVKSKSKKTYKSAAAFFEEYNSQENREFYSEKELNYFLKTAITENYLLVAQNLDQTYENIDIVAMGEAEIAKYGVSGEAAETLRASYLDLEKRFEEMVEKGEHKHFFFYGQVYEMHSLLYKDILRFVIYEILILVVLLTAFLVHFEYDNKTELVAYSTKRGRKLMIDKLVVSLYASAVVTSVILGSTLLVCFLTFDFSGLWDVPINSAFMSEANIFYLSWWDLSVVQYLICVIALIYICQLLFVTLIFILSSIIRNSYIVFILFAIIFGIGMLLPGYIPANSNLSLAAAFTPFTLIYAPFVWFMGTGLYTVFEFYEVVTAGIWILILAILSFFCLQRFYRQNI